jgi:hypothetical protein
MQQPSAQGIASLYMGNPGALQQAVQKEQKANPGLPPDLQKMLALQIVNNEHNAVAAQTAMQQLKQMSGPTGQMPTVMQSLEQQAQQKLTARAPQPTQGIDQLPSQFSMAEGGIVAFDDGGDVPYETAYDRMTRKNREESAARDTPESRADSEGIMKALKFVGGLPIEALKTLVSAPGYGLSKDEPRAAAPRVADTRAALNAADAASYSAPARAEAPARGLQQLAAQTAPAARPAAPRAPATPTDPNELAYQNALKDMSLDRDARAAAAQARLKEQVGGPGTEQYDRMVAELEKRKADFEAPKAGFEGLMEYLGQVAQTGRGKKWYEAGAEGGARVEALNKERKAQQFELAKQQVELLQKKMGAERGYKKELFQLGEAERAAVDKQIDTAVKEYGLSKRQADQLRAELERTHIAGGYQLKAAQVRGEGGEGKQQLNELKALQKQYTDQLKTTYNKADKASLQAKLDAVESEIAKMAGLGTMRTAPGAGSPGGIPSDVQALLNKYGGK